MAFNYHWRGSDSPLKIRFRKHTCYVCNEPLTIVKHRKVVSPKSEEAKRYPSRMPGGGVYVGPVEFRHNVFFCSSCQRTIEFVTQVSFEDLDRCMAKVERYMRKKKGRYIRIVKRYAGQDGELHEMPHDISQMTGIYLFAKENDELRHVYTARIARESRYERPHYFTVKKRKLMAAVKEALDIR